MGNQKLPPSWDADRVRQVLNHYEGRSEDGQAAEIEAALPVTLMAVPNDLAPAVQALIRHRPM